jgi:hypothetical protein
MKKYKNYRLVPKKMVGGALVEPSATLFCRIYPKHGMNPRDPYLFNREYVSCFTAVSSDITVYVVKKSHIRGITQSKIDSLEDYGIYNDGSGKKILPVIVADIYPHKINEHFTRINHTITGIEAKDLIPPTGSTSGGGTAIRFRIEKLTKDTSPFSTFLTGYAFKNIVVNGLRLLYYLSFLYKISNSSKDKIEIWYNNIRSGVRDIYNFYKGNKTFIKLIYTPTKTFSYYDILMEEFIQFNINDDALHNHFNEIIGKPIKEFVDVILQDHADKQNIYNEIFFKVNNNYSTGAVKILPEQNKWTSKFILFLKILTMFQYIRVSSFINLFMKLHANAINFKKFSLYISKLTKVFVDYYLQNIGDIYPNEVVSLQNYPTRDIVEPEQEEAPKIIDDIEPLNIEIEMRLGHQITDNDITFTYEFYGSKEKTLSWDEWDEKYADVKKLIQTIPVALVKQNENATKVLDSFNSKLNKDLTELEKFDTDITSLNTKLIEASAILKLKLDEDYLTPGEINDHGNLLIKSVKGLEGLRTTLIKLKHIKHTIHHLNITVPLKTSVEATIKNYEDLISIIKKKLKFTYYILISGNSNVLVVDFNKEQVVVDHTGQIYVINSEVELPSTIDTESVIMKMRKGTFLNPGKILAFDNQTGEDLNIKNTNTRTTNLEIAPGEDDTVKFSNINILEFELGQYKVAIKRDYNGTTILH